MVSSNFSPFLFLVTGTPCKLCTTIPKKKQEVSKKETHTCSGLLLAFLCTVQITTWAGVRETNVWNTERHTLIMGHWGPLGGRGWVDAASRSPRFGLDALWEFQMMMLLSSQDGSLIWFLSQDQKWQCYLGPDAGWSPCHIVGPSDAGERCHGQLCLGSVALWELQMMT